MPKIRRYAVGLLLFGIVGVFSSLGQADDRQPDNQLVAPNVVAETSNDDQKRGTRSIVEAGSTARREAKRNKRARPFGVFSKIMEPFIQFKSAYDSVESLATPIAGIATEVGKFVEDIMRNNLTTNDCIVKKILASQILNFILRIDKIQNECGASSSSNTTEATPEKSDDE